MFIETFTPEESGRTKKAEKSLQLPPTPPPPCSDPWIKIGQAVMYGQRLLDNNKGYTKKNWILI